MSPGRGARPAGLATLRAGRKGPTRPMWWPARVGGGLPCDLKAVGAGALLLALAGCASASSQEIAGRPEQSPPPGLATRLQALSEKYVIEERPSRNPARIRAQIANLEARRSKLLERYTPTHPGVLQIDRQLRTLQEQLAAAEAAQPTPASPAP